VRVDVIVCDRDGPKSMFGPLWVMKVSVGEVYGFLLSRLGPSYTPVQPSVAFCETAKSCRVRFWLDLDRGTAAL
jgi:hypothetical protein